MAQSRSAETLRDMFASETVVDLPRIQVALGGASSMTAFRYLRQIPSDDLTSRNLRRAQFQHQAQICPREQRLRRVEILAQFLDHLVGGGVGGMMQSHRQGSRLRIR